MVDCDVDYIFGIVCEGYACRYDETVNVREGCPFVCQFTDSLQESTSFPKRRSTSAQHSTTLWYLTRIPDMVIAEFPCGPSPIMVLCSVVGQEY